MALNYTSSAIDEVPDEVTTMDVAELINERYSNCEFALDVNMFNYHQQKDKEIQTQIEKEIKEYPNSTLYTTKEVEEVELMHKNNKILVPIILQERVMNWYHSILMHIDCNSMEDSIRSLYTWKGL